MYDLAPSDETSEKRIAWFTSILAVGLVIAFATQNAIAGAVLPSLYSGSRLFRTGAWILRTDDDKVRGRICFTFYLSSACWMGSVAAFATVLSFIAISSITGDDPDMDEFAATMITLIVCVLISSVLGVAATIAAVSNQIRVWVHPRLHGWLDQQASEDAYPKRPYETFNYAVFVLATSLAFPILAIGCLTLLRSASGIRGLIFLVGGPIGIVTAYMWLSERIIASCPAEYWAIPSRSNS
jgi:hypothetical protein